MAGEKNKRIVGYSLLFSLTMLLFAARCDNEKPFASQEITFVLPAKVNPEDSLVNVGDTIWLEVNTPDLLYEFNSKKRYRLSDFNFGQTSIVVRQLVSKDKDLSDQLGAATSFHLIDEDGVITFPGDTFVDFNFHYNEVASKYVIMIGFVPKTRGVYCLQFLSSDNVQYDGIVNLGKDRDGATIIPVYKGIYFPINETGNNNYELFKNNCRALYSGSLDSVGYYREFKGTFTFRVVE